MKNLSLGRKIAKLRKLSDMSQKDLAKKLNVSDKLISKWECNNGTPDIDMLQQISKVFNISINELLDNYNKETKLLSRKKLTILIISAFILVSSLVGIILGIKLTKNNQDKTSSNNIDSNINISSNLFDIDKINSKLYCSVSNTTESIDLNNSITLDTDYGWKLYKDIECTQDIPSKSLNLEIGDNNLFILISNSKEQQLYKLTIRRKPIYQVEFNLNNGDIVSNQYIEEDNLIEKPNDPSKTGYTFSHWDYNILQPIKSNVVITAIFIPNTYKINYHDKNTGNVLSQDVVYNTTINLFNNLIFARDYYTLSCWSTSDISEDEIFDCNSEFEFMTDNNLDLYAVWKPIEYQINYEMNGGTNDSNNPNSFNIENLDILLLNPTKNGYQFDGWYLEENYKTEVSNIKDVAISNLNLYSKWTYISIYDAQDLINYLSEPLNWVGEFKLFSDINLNEMEWTPIGTIENKFTGIFDGNGHFISNFKITENSQYNGFFGYTDNAKILNLEIKNISFNIEFEGYRTYIGGFIGCATNSEIKNCCGSGNIFSTSLSNNSESYLGGIVGYAYQLVAEKCYSTIEVENSVSYASYIGGFVGYIISGSITNCYTTGNIIGKATFSTVSVGGFAGYTSAVNDKILEISNSYSIGECYAESHSPHVGGFIGSVKFSDIGYISVNNCYTLGNIEAYAIDEKSTTEIGWFFGQFYMSGGEWIFNNCFTDSQQQLEANGDGYKQINMFSSLITQLNKEEIWLRICELWKNDVWNLYLDKNPTLK